MFSALKNQFSPVWMQYHPIEDTWRRDNNLRDPAFSALQEVTCGGANGNSEEKSEEAETPENSLDLQSM